VIEITETALLDSPERWSARLGRIRALGMAIAIDDFGVGFASLAYLFQFRPAA
jgi:EAL domain-containing protein (putative c-di-GMP-specific phosphodiesterase class I)